MKKYLVLAFLGIGLIACKEGASNQEDVATVSEELTSEEPGVFGEEFKNEATLTAFELGDIYSNLKVGDTINVTFEGPVQEVCQAKGCWMQVDVGAADPVMIKFKDYGFFVPKDSENTEVIVEGKAFLNEMSVEDQKHYAEDEGKSEAEIEAITSPQITRAFIAEGVLLKE